MREKLVLSDTQFSYIIILQVTNGIKIVSRGCMYTLDQNDFCLMHKAWYDGKMNVGLPDKLIFSYILSIKF